MQEGFCLFVLFWFCTDKPRRRKETLPRSLRKPTFGIVPSQDFGCNNGPVINVLLIQFRSECK